MSCHFLLQGIFLIQKSNLGLLRCRQIFLPTELQGKARTQLEFSWTNERISLACESGLGGRVSLPTLICSNAARRTFWCWKGLGLFSFLFSCPSRCQSTFLSPGILNILTQIIYNYNRRRISVCIHWWSRTLRQVKCPVQAPKLRQRQGFLDCRSSNPTYRLPTTEPLGREAPLLGTATEFSANACLLNERINKGRRQLYT